MTALDASVAARITAGLLKTQRDRDQFNAACRDFRAFLQFWHFVDRESGAVRVLGDGLWPGQAQFVNVVSEHRQVISVKAGKLGFSQIETAFCVWRALGQQNARTTLFSKDLAASFALVEYCRFGLLRLPSEWGIELRTELAGGHSARSLKFTSRYFDRDDVRSIVSVAATDSGAIDTSSTHLCLDEIAHYEHAEAVFNSAATTLAPGGTMHLLSRGAGPGWFADLFEAARDGDAGDLRAFFVDWRGRPDRDEAWRAGQGNILSGPGLRHYAPETVEDALAGDDSGIFCRPEWWDACRESLPPLLPGDKTPIVLGVDAGYASDNFAIVGVSRHPTRHDDVAVRLVRVLDPKETGYVDLDTAEQLIRQLIENFNVVQIAYDVYQMKLLADRLTKDRLVWVEEFSQQGARLTADRGLYDLIVSRRLAHDGDEKLRAHVLNAGARASRDGTTIRLEKRQPTKKIDAAVALSMAASRCLWLVL